MTQGAARTFYTQIAAHGRLAHVNVLYLHLDLVLLAIRRLASLESASWAEEGR